MEYGERLYKKAWYYGQRVEVFYRYRIDPVPGIYRRFSRGFGNWYKTPKTINEKRQVCGNEKYVRLKRNITNLPDPWDDYPRADSFNKRSWKKSFKCKKQWEKNCGKK